MGWIEITSLCCLICVLVVVDGRNEDGLNGKVIAGYQGWFCDSCDESKRGVGSKWRHWSKTGESPARSKSPFDTGLAFDLWPDLSEYVSSSLCATNLSYSDGSPAFLFSAYDLAVVDLHFKWAKSYGIDGLFLQRFVSELTDPRMVDFRDKVMENVKMSAEKHSVSFAIMYDVSGAPDDTLKEVIENDWKNIAPLVIGSPQYQHHNQKPVVCLWGFGFSDRTQNISQAEEIASFFRNYPTTSIAGVPYWWREGKRDAKEGWLQFDTSFDIISPWSVGRYSSSSQFDTLWNSVALPDIEFCHQRKKDYAPVVFPGFSWANLKDDPSTFNQIPRMGGSFFSHQGEVVGSSSSLFVYVAMFDEVNEGTAIFKACPSNKSLPVGAKFLSLDADGYTLSPDTFLVLAGKIGAQLKAQRESGN